MINLAKLLEELRDVTNVRLGLIAQRRVAEEALEAAREVLEDAKLRLGDAETRLQELAAAEAAAAETFGTAIRAVNDAHEVAVTS